MPILALKCPGCNHRWEGLKSFSTADPSIDACPKCGAPPEQLPVAGVHAKGIDLDSLDPLERQEHLEAKRYYESRSEDILSGAITLSERGPKELRPQCPEHLKKHYF